MRPLFARLTYFIHLAAIAYIVLGWLLPVAHLTVHIFVIPLTILHWRTNNNQCILTQLQHYFEGSQLNKDNQGDFTKSLFRTIGIQINEQQLLYVMYGVMLLSLSLSLIRLYLL